MVDQWWRLLLGCGHSGHVPLQLMLIGSKPVCTNQCDLWNIRNIRAFQQVYLDNFWSFKRTNWLAETTSPSLPVLFILQSSFLKALETLWRNWELLQNHVFTNIRSIQNIHIHVYHTHVLNNSSFIISHSTPWYPEATTPPHLLHGISEKGPIWQWWWVWWPHMRCSCHGWHQRHCPRPRWAASIAHVTDGASIAMTSFRV